MIQLLALREGMTTMELESGIREVLIESNECLGPLDRDLLLLEETPDDKRLIASVVRGIQTIKGTCGCFGFGILGSVTHLAANILSQVRERDRTLNNVIVSLIRRSGLRGIRSRRPMRGHKGPNVELFAPLRRLQHAKYERHRPSTEGAPATPVQDDWIIISTTETATQSMENAIHAGASERPNKPFIAGVVEEKILPLGVIQEDVYMEILLNMLSKALKRKRARRFPVRVLVVDDSVVMPQLITRMLGDEPDVDVVGITRDDREALAKRALLNPYLASGDFHPRVFNRSTGVRVVLDQGKRECFCRPAVDVLSRSVSEVYGGSALATVLLGMGADGVAGVRMLKGLGTSVLVQNKEKSVVWGMPGAIAEGSLADGILPLEAIYPSITRLI